jgi:hypothetical protein
LPFKNSNRAEPLLFGGRLHSRSLLVAYCPYSAVRNS